MNSAFDKEEEKREKDLENEERKKKEEQEKENIKKEEQEKKEKEEKIEDDKRKEQEKEFENNTKINAGDAENSAGSKKTEENEENDKEKSESDTEKNEGIKVVGSGKDLVPASHGSIYWNGDNDEFFGDDEGYKNKTKDRVGSDKGGTPNEDTPPPENENEKTPESDDEDRNEIYKLYRKNIGDMDFRHVHHFLRKSGLTQVDIVKAVMQARMYADASGLIVAARRLKIKKAAEEMTDGQRQMAAYTMTYLFKEGKVKSGQFSNNIKGYQEFKNILDKEILERTKVDLSRMSSKKISAAIKSGFIKDPIVANNTIKNLALRTGNISRMDDTVMFAYTSLTLQKYIENEQKLMLATRRQNRSRIRLVDELMGNDVDLWNGTKKVRKIRRYLKKLKRLKHWFESNSSSTVGAPRRTVYEKPPALEAEKTSVVPAKQKVSTPPAKTASVNKNSAFKEKMANTVAKLTGKTTRTTALLSSGATTGTTAASATAAGATSAGTAAASTSASAGIAAVGIAAIVIVLAILIVGVVVLVTGSINGAFHGDKENASDNTSDAEKYQSMLYACYENLNKHDKELLLMIEDGVSEREAGYFSNNLYENLANYDFNKYKNPITGQGMTILPVLDENDKVAVGNYNCNGQKLPAFKSNAKDILCMAAVVIGNESEGTPQTMKRYAENLWYDTHNVKLAWVETSDGKLNPHPCSGRECTATYVCRANQYTIEQGEGVEPITVYELGLYDEQGNLIDILFQNKTENGVSTPTFSSLYHEIEKLRDSGYLFGYQSFDEENWEPISEYGTDRYYRFCAGHAKYEVAIVTNYIGDNGGNLLDSSIFSVDTFTNDPANAEFWNGKENGFFQSLFANMGLKEKFTRLTSSTRWDGEPFTTYTGALALDKEVIAWDGWTDDNKEWAIQFYSDDWYELYGISFAVSGSGGNIMDDSQIGDLSGKAEGEIAEILEFALGTVGRIPYYWGGKQNISVKYSDYPDMSVAEFLSTYYSHLGTQTVSVSNNNPVSVSGWYGCGGVDSKRNIIGLDCSGWVSFVYNNFGVDVGAGTGGLSTTGTAVSYYDLKPGDLLIDHSSNAHVVMFVCWDNEEKTSYTTVECAGSSGVVARSGVTKTWEYYRRVIN